MKETMADVSSASPSSERIQLTIYTDIAEVFFVFYLFILYFLQAFYYTRTYRNIRTDITTLTQITLITNYGEATLYFTTQQPRIYFYTANLSIMNGNKRKGKKVRITATVVLKGARVSIFFCRGNRV